MKKLLTGALSILVSHAAFAQSLAPSSGFSVRKLFDAVPGTTISGLDVDAAGNIYTIEGDFGVPTVYRRSAADGYATAAPFFTFSEAVFGTFIRIQGNTVYFGESKNGLVYAKLTTDTDPATARVVGTFAGNYDLKFSGANAYLSYNPGGISSGEAKVALLDVTTGALDTIVDTSANGPGDFSGPIAFDARGALYYGATDINQFNGGPAGNIFAFEPTEVAGAVGATSLSLPGTAFIENGSNQFLQFDGGTGLFQTYSAGFGDMPATISLYDLGTRAATSVATSGDNEFLGGIGYLGGTLYAALTNATFSGASVFAIVPEPASTLLLVLGLTVFLRRRRSGI